MLYCTSTVTFGATSLKGGFKLFSPSGEYGAAGRDVPCVFVLLLQVLSLFLNALLHIHRHLQRRLIPYRNA
jgi:hypothetical protein